MGNKTLEDLKGRFVVSSQNNRGAGKIKSLTSTTADIEYFHSIADQYVETLPLQSLKRMTLPHQTRCYLWLEGFGQWQMGRIGQHDRESDEYEVLLPEQRGGYFSEKEIYVRWNRPIDEPIETLVHKGHDTPFFHDMRRVFLDSLVKQRAAAHGMTGLISSKIDLYAHQVEVIRRVLEDPIQRYLLADEVGLGKTIEAGAILRQFLLDVPEGEVLVLVPSFLVGQWQKELEDKFQVHHFPERVRILGTESIGDLKGASEFEMVIVDEAHHVAAKAFSDDPREQQIFNLFRECAHRAERLLLLSATPVLNNEQDFLAMLNLLDPHFYNIEDIDAFKERISKRQDIGKALMAFRDDVRPFQLRLGLRRIREIFQDDPFIQDQGEELERLLANPEDSSYGVIVRSIRIHISETYRLHRRMLRSRRDSIDEDFLQGRYSRDDGRPSLIREYDLDEQTEEVHNLIEEWRVTALGSEHENQDDALFQIFLMLFRYSGTWLQLLGEVIKMRLNRSPSPEFREELGDHVDLICSSPLFEGENEILQAVLQVINKEPEEGDRIELLKMVLENILHTHSDNTSPLIAVFTSFTACANEILSRLAKDFGASSIAGHTVDNSREDIEEELLRFQTDPDCKILVCDRSGEEGRNLQHADWIIHFDLPWSPNQLEQRIGRLDRIGRQLPLRSRVFLGADLEDPVSMHEAWFQVLCDGLGVFYKSIAGLQFFVDERLHILQRILFRDGAIGLLDQIEQIQKDIEEEHIRINEQNTLDEIDALEKNAAIYFDGLSSIDAHYREMQHSLESWMCDALGFTKDSKEEDDLVRYRPIRKTLVPFNLLYSRLLGFQNWGSFRRDIAAENPEVALHRIGEDLIEAMADYIRWDDRGQAFALWRHVPTWDAEEGSEWVGFRFTYIIEADTREAQQVLDNLSAQGNPHAIRRRGDSYFSPMLQTIYVDTAGEEPIDPELLQLLDAPYQKTSRTGYVDYNLAKERLGILNEVIPSDYWTEICQRTREKSESLLGEKATFRQICEERYGLANQELEARLYQIQLRATKAVEEGARAYGADSEDIQLEKELNNALLEGIRKPRFRLDSVGFLVVSGRPPSIV
jgi:ATP-dependent helicase HepA